MSLHTTKRLLLIGLVLSLATGIVACGETDGEEEEQTEEEETEEEETEEEEEEEEGIEVAGTWETQFSTTETIDEEMWSFMYLVDYSNDDRRAVTQNPDDDEHNPDAYNVLEWTPIENDVFYYCTAEFGIETEDEAHHSQASPDADDLESGCGGFEWTEMTRL